jgi:hypothetical protein
VWHKTDGAIPRRDLGSARHLVSRTAQILLIAVFFCVLFWLVPIYSAALRDPRFLDGWMLVAGMGLQLGFHIALKTNRLSPKSVARMRTFHIFIGWLLIAAFIAHSDFSLPDTGFELALWAGFVLVTLSGVFGTYLAWSLQAKGRVDEHIGFDRLGARIAELGRDVRKIVTTTDAVVSTDLPMSPYDAWIVDLYTNHLRAFFDGHRNLRSHLVGSQRPLKRITNEIDNLSRYVDAHCKEKLTTIRNLAIEKDRLDFARVHHALSNGWLFVHVPVTYALIVLSMLHILVVYSFSSGG